MRIQRHSIAQVLTSLSVAVAVFVGGGTASAAALSSPDRSAQPAITTADATQRATPPGPDPIARAAIAKADAALHTAPTPNATVTTSGPRGTLKSPVAGEMTVTGVTGSVVARPQADGLQVLSVLNHGSSARFDVSLPKGLHLQQSGSDLLIVDQTGMVEVGKVRAPYAIDATGRMLPTHYVLSGNSIVQMIDTTRAAYPIVADPWVTFGWYVYVHIEPWFQETILGMGVAGLGAWLGATLCTADIVGGPEAVAACLAVVAAGAFGVWSVIDHYWSSTQVMTLKFYYWGQFAGWNYGS